MHLLGPEKIFGTVRLQYLLVLLGKCGFKTKLGRLRPDKSHRKPDDPMSIQWTTGHRLHHDLKAAWRIILYKLWSVINAIRMIAQVGHPLKALTTGSF